MHHKLLNPNDPASAHTHNCPGCAAERTGNKMCHCGCLLEGHGNRREDGSCDRHPLYCFGYWPHDEERPVRQP